MKTKTLDAHIVGLASLSVFFRLKRKKIRFFRFGENFLGRLQKNLRHFRDFFRKVTKKQRKIVCGARNTKNFRLRRAFDQYYSVGLPYVRMGIYIVFENLNNFDFGTAIYIVFYNGVLAFYVC